MGDTTGWSKRISQGCFDNIDHEWMIRMLAERIEDRARRRVIKPWLNAGVLDTDGQGLHPVTGTPPGGSSHPSWRMWTCTRPWRCGSKRWSSPRVEERHVGAGTQTLSWCSERPPEAERFYPRLGQRLGKCGLELSAEKTRVMPCSRQPPAPKTSFECLGFECRWDKDRAGKAPVTRRTARKKLRNSLKRCTHRCREHRHLRLGVLLARLNAKLRGSYHDDGVPGHSAGLTPCFSQALGILQKWLNRRRQRRRYQLGGLSRAAGARQRRTTTDRGATPDQRGRLSG